MRGLIDVKVNINDEAKRTLNMYISRKLNPFFEKLLEALYIHQPDNVEEFTRDFLDGKFRLISSSFSN